MKKVLVTVLLVMFSLGFAQGRLFGEALGASMGFVPSFGVSASAAMGAERVLGPMDLRGGFGFSSGGSFSLFADLLYPIAGQSLNFNLGGGLIVAGGGGSAAFGIRGIAGLEIPVTSIFSVLVELQPTIIFTGGSSFGMGIEVGPRLYF